MTTEQYHQAGGPCPAVVVAVQPCPDGWSEQDLRLLPAHERSRAAELGSHRGSEFARGRALLRRLVSRELGGRPCEVPVEVSRTGSLSLRGIRAGVSLSHSVQWTVAAVHHGGEVGVDVQEPPQRLDDGLVRRCLGPSAPAVLAMPTPGRGTTFAQVWAAQEACVKAVGLGLSGAPWRIPVPPGARSGRWRDVRWQLWDWADPAALAVATRCQPWCACQHSRPTASPGTTSTPADQQE